MIKKTLYTILCFSLASLCLYGCNNTENGSTSDIFKDDVIDIAEQAQNSEDTDTLYENSSQNSEDTDTLCENSSQKQGDVLENDVMRIIEHVQEQVATEAIYEEATLYEAYYNLMTCKESLTEEQLKEYSELYYDVETAMEVFLTNKTGEYADCGHIYDFQTNGINYTCILPLLSPDGKQNPEADYYVKIVKSGDKWELSELTKID